MNNRSASTVMSALVVMQFDISQSICVSLLYDVFQVVHDVGLCIALWDVTKLEDSYIFPGDGASHTIGEVNLGGVLTRLGA